MWFNVAVNSILKNDKTFNKLLDECLEKSCKETKRCEIYIEKKNNLHENKFYGSVV